MADPLFRLVCVPAALDGAPAGWAAEMLVDGDVALMPDDSGLAGIDAVAHALGTAAIPVMRQRVDARAPRRNGPQPRRLAAARVAGAAVQRPGAPMGARTAAR